MKIAIVHDYIKEYGGAERVLETLHEIYPDAPVFTLVYCPEFLGPHKKRFETWDIRPSLLQRIPVKHKLISPFRLLAPFVFPMFDFSDYDVVIVSATGAYSPNTINKRSAKQICYYHTPPRYLYGLATAREWKKSPLFRVVGKIAFSWLKKVDIASSKHVDIAIANSQNVAERIKKFYNKESVVIYPPVDVPSLSFLRRQESISGSRITTRVLPSPKGRKSGMTGYFAAGGRLARPKHIDLIIKVANELGLELKIFGKGFAGYGEELQKMINDQGSMTNKIELVGEVTDEEKTELLAGAKAYIFASDDEDFGMLPVEAMGVGTPVIAYNSGGPKESVIDGKTGVFFDELSAESLAAAIKNFEALRLRSGKKMAEDCIQQAQKFSKEEFKKKIQDIVN